MKYHSMRLNPEPYSRIISGTKKSELRINDEKRQQIEVGDIIEFTNRENDQQKMSVEVTYLNTYPNFASMYEGVKQDYPSWEQEPFVRSMYQYYTPEEETKYGTVEIGFRLTDEKN